MPLADLPLSKEQGLEGQMPSTELVFAERVIPNPLVGTDAATKALFKGPALSEGPLPKTFLEKQVAS